MPYITKDKRYKLDDAINELSNVLNEELDVDDIEGNLNFTITSLIDDHFSRSRVNYKNINALIGMLECCKIELYRKLAAPYEDQKERENGVVLTCLKKI